MCFYKKYIVLYAFGLHGFAQPVLPIVVSVIDQCHGHVLDLNQLV